MKETTSASQKPKDALLNLQELLSEREIESLRQDKRDFHELAKILFKDVKPL